MEKLPSVYSLVGLTKYDRNGGITAAPSGPSGENEGGKRNDSRVSLLTLVFVSFSPNRIWRLSFAKMAFEFRFNSTSKTARCDLLQDLSQNFLILYFT